MIKFLNKNKFLILLLIAIVVLFTYCGLQTFVINDDLPYSLFYRGPERITNISQIIQNQLSDYLTINGRFFIHCVVQFVLMFGKNLFSIINALCIVTTLMFMKKIINLKSLDFKLDSIYTLLFLLGMFLLLGNFKYLIYWVAGSVNYIWLFTLLIIFIYYYLKVGIKKYKILNFILFFVFSMVHECSFVFILFLIIADFIKILIDKKEKLDKKTILLYLGYVVFAVVGGLIVLKAPGNTVRTSTAQWWYDMPFIDRIFKSIPVVSSNLFGLFNIENLIPTILVITLIFYGIKLKNKLVNITTLSVTLISILSVVLNNGWLYFVLCILIFIDLIIINYINKDNDMSALTLAFYAVVFSMIITPEYSGARPNYYIYIWMMIYICIFINNFLNKKSVINIFKVIIIIFSMFMCYREIKIYNYIGNIHKERLSQIEKVKKEDLKVLEYKIIDEKYAKYHPDSNSPSDNSYWAYTYFRYYYVLDEDVTIKLVD